MGVIDGVSVGEVVQVGRNVLLGCGVQDGRSVCVGRAVACASSSLTNPMGVAVHFLKVTIVFVDVGVLLGPSVFVTVGLAKNGISCTYSASVLQPETKIRMKVSASTTFHFDCVILFNF